MAHIFRVYIGEELVARKETTESIIKVGRDPKSHLCVDSVKASRMHAVLEDNMDGTLTLIDLGNEPGTHVNGARVNKCKIKEMDSIEIGEYRIVYEGILDSIPEKSEEEEKPEVDSVLTSFQELMGKAVAGDQKKRVAALQDRLEEFQEEMSKAADKAIASVKELDENVKSSVIMRLPAEAGWKYAESAPAENILDPTSRKIEIKEVRWWGMLGPMEMPKGMDWMLTCLPVDPDTNQVVSILRFQGIFGPGVSVEEAREKITSKVKKAMEEGMGQVKEVEDETGIDVKEFIHGFLEKFKEGFAQD
jgi:pSer/pThr/pTyr-binding forkhead associated (FHA) protein